MNRNKLETKKLHEFSLRIALKDFKSRFKGKIMTSVIQRRGKHFLILGKFLGGKSFIF